MKILIDIILRPIKTIKSGIAKQYDFFRFFIGSSIVLFVLALGISCVMEKTVLVQVSLIIFFSGYIYIITTSGVIYLFVRIAEKLIEKRHMADLKPFLKQLFPALMVQLFYSYISLMIITLCNDTFVKMIGSIIGNIISLWLISIACSILKFTYNFSKKSLLLILILYASITVLFILWGGMLPKSAAM